jgi:hypothetical protein
MIREPSFEEFKTALHSMKRGLAPGPSGFSTELTQHGGEVAQQVVHSVVCSAFKTRGVPAMFKHGLIFPTPKDPNITHSLDKVSPQHQRSRLSSN